MGKRMTVHSMVMDIKVACESCGHEYLYTHVISHRQDGSPVPQDREIGKRALEDKVKRALENHEVGYHPCPKCNHVPTWMKKQHPRGRRSSIVGTVLFAALSALVLGAYLARSSPDLLSGGHDASSILTKLLSNPQSLPAVIMWGLAVVLVAYLTRLPFAGSRRERFVLPAKPPKIEIRR